ncbi:hypothetical protein JOD64_004521 [Micromonospora luteifusca]|uniref:TfoX N-terminal domain-containing protein n=1 Tax=Micromonospora luteifusca TaxID=709860 RepID=A0ABS2LZJ6_9ACTN|nr:hypothetical protein [Micromonospora luteifusca]MBM7493299.1 hypothetical protein [Micromonospora luteifusca]
MTLRTAEANGLVVDGSAAALERLLPGNEIAEEFTHQPDVAMGTMFRSPGLRTDGKIFAFLGHNGELIVKLPQDRARQFVDAGTAEEVTTGTRTMREWVAFPAGGSDPATLTLWRDVAQDAYQYVHSLQQPS